MPACRRPWTRRQAQRCLTTLHDSISSGIKLQGWRDVEADAVIFCNVAGQAEAPAACLSSTALDYEAHTLGRDCTASATVQGAPQVQTLWGNVLQRHK